MRLDSRDEKDADFNRRRLKAPRGKKSSTLESVDKTANRIANYARLLLQRQKPENKKKKRKETERIFVSARSPQSEEEQQVSGDGR